VWKHAERSTGRFLQGTWIVCSVVSPTAFRSASQSATVLYYSPLEMLQQRLHMQGNLFPQQVPIARKPRTKKKKKRAAQSEYVLTKQKQHERLSHRLTPDIVHSLGVSAQILVFPGCFSCPLFSAITTVVGHPYLHVGSGREGPANFATDGTDRPCTVHRVSSRSPS
jgi:hypothetical protein